MKSIRMPAPLAGMVVFLFGTSALAGDAPRDPPDAAPPQVVAASVIEAGRYIAIIGACNDCHTPGYDQNGLDVDERLWLTGTSVGWQGPWGTTYPSNLRLLVDGLGEDAWVAMLKTRTGLPPMPWPNVNRMSERDARALYRYIRSLGPAGERMPSAVPAGQEPATPYLVLEPQPPRARQGSDD